MLMRCMRGVGKLSNERLKRLAHGIGMPLVKHLLGHDMHLPVAAVAQRHQVIKGVVGLVARVFPPPVYVVNVVAGFTARLTGALIPIKRLTAVAVEFGIIPTVLRLLALADRLCRLGVAALIFTNLAHVRLLLAGGAAFLHAVLVGVVRTAFSALQDRASGKDATGRTQGAKAGPVLFFANLCTAVRAPFLRAARWFVAAPAHTAHAGQVAHAGHADVTGRAWSATNRVTAAFYEGKAAVLALCVAVVSHVVSLGESVSPLYAQGVNNG